MRVYVLWSYPPPSHIVAIYSDEGYAADIASDLGEGYWVEEYEVN